MMQNSNKMKKQITLFSLSVVCITVVLSSCSTAKNMVVENKLTTVKLSETTNEYKVEFKNGESKQYTSLQLITGVLQVPHLLANGTEKIMPADIVSYSTPSCYAISQSLFENNIKSYVAKGVLPGFAKRVVKGSVNVYSLNLYNGHNVFEKLYVQSGNDGKIVPCTSENLNEYVKDNIEISNYLKKKSKKLSSKQIIAITTQYNNAFASSLK